MLLAVREQGRWAVQACPLHGCSCEDAALEASSNQLSAPSRLLGELRRSLSGEQVSARTSGLLGRGVEVEGWSGVPV